MRKRPRHRQASAPSAWQNLISRSGRNLHPLQATTLLRRVGLYEQFARVKNGWPPRRKRKHERQNKNKPQQSENKDLGAPRGVLSIQPSSHQGAPKGSQGILAEYWIRRRYNYGEKGNATQSTHARATGENSEGKGPIAELPLRPWIKQPALLGAKTMKTLCAQQRSLEGTRLRYPSRGEDAGALSRLYIRRSTQGPIRRTCSKGLSPVDSHTDTPTALQIWATMPLTNYPSSRVP